MIWVSGILFAISPISVELVTHIRAFKTNGKVRKYSAKKLLAELTITMKNNPELAPIVIFAESAEDRDFYRSSMSANFGKTFCFEKESTCFDNLETISPLAVILKTENESVIWRFIFVIMTFKLESTIFVASDSFDIETFLSEEEHQLTGIRLSGFNTKNELLKKIFNMNRNRNIPRADGNDRNVLTVGRSAPIRQIKSQLLTLRNSDDPVLISGEPGVGKESLVRQIISGLSKDAILIKLNCKAFNSRKDPNNEILPRRLFKTIEPHSAINREENKEQPVVIYLDRLNGLDDAAQLEILLLLDEVSRKVSALPNLNCSIRFISTAEENMEDLVRKGQFRVDLYYRLNVIPIHIPPLRQRREDIPLLVDYFLITECLKARKSLMTISPPARDILYCYEWPNNIDELANIIKRVAQTRNEGAILKNKQFSTVTKNNGNLLLHSLNKEAIPDLMEIKNSINSTTNLSLKNICEKFASSTEKKIMKKALESTNWNRKKAAALLNISYKSMLNKMKMYELA